MSLKKVSASGLTSWVDGLIKEHKVIGVQAKGDRFAFGPLKKADDLRLDYDVSQIAPGRLCFQPPREPLLRFQGVEFESVYECEPFVLLGVHPYDMVAINQMDKIFALDNRDEHYFARRNAATIVVCDVQTPSKNVFAGCMGTATVKEGFDVLLTKIDGHYVVEARTEKGEALVKSMSGAAASDADKKAREKVWRQNEKKLRKHELKPAPSDLPALLDRAKDHPVWKEKARLCFSCGSCTNTCPTCYCFDVQDDVNWDLKSGARVRTWDSCQLAKFARVAGGHNFRPEAYERFRHRYYRKGKYVPEKIGECACVGCGRCITACVAGIACPPEIFNRLLEGK
jgi:sulfhydrogenase subunit beta (sulfur reductase)